MATPGFPMTGGAPSSACPHQYCFMTFATDDSDPVAADGANADGPHSDRTLAEETERDFDNPEMPWC